MIEDIKIRSKVASYVANLSNFDLESLEGHQIEGYADVQKILRRNPYYQHVFAEMVIKQAREYQGTLFLLKGNISLLNEVIGNEGDKDRQNSVEDVLSRVSFEAGKSRQEANTDEVMSTFDYVKALAKDYFDELPRPRMLDLAMVQFRCLNNPQHNEIYEAMMLSIQVQKPEAMLKIYDNTKKMEDFLKTL
jgi:hypothetical protein